MSDVRTLMLQRAADIATSVHCEEAWHIVSLYQKSHPRNFLNIIHNIMASYLNLSHDYFNEDCWPPVSNLLPQLTDENEDADLSSDSETKLNIDLPRIDSVYLRGNMISSPSRSHLNKFSKILNDSHSVLPSMHKIQSDISCTSSEDYSSTDSSGVFHPAFRSPYSQLPGLHTPYLGRRKNINDFPFSRKIDPDSTICRYILDYLLSKQDICKVEGLFRRPGNQSRIMDLKNRLYNIVLSHSYRRMVEPNPAYLLDEELYSDYEDVTQPLGKNQSKRFLVYKELEKFSPHDITCLLMKSLSKCCQSGRNKCSEQRPLITNQISELLYMATQLQYDLSGPIFGPNEDWTHILCHARQLLTYRIVIQLLMPKPERRLFTKLLELFRRIDEHQDNSMMSAESIATCVVVPLLGAPTSSDHENLWNNSNKNNEVSSLKLRIDSLTNLIRSSGDLHSIPGLVYKSIKSHLRSKLGHSPVQKCSRKVNIDFSVSMTSQNQPVKSTISQKPKPLHRSTSINEYKHVKFLDNFNNPVSGNTRNKVTDRPTASSKLKDAFFNWRRTKFPPKSEKTISLRKVKSSMSIKK